MLKHALIAAVSLSSLAFAAPVHRARPVVAPPAPVRTAPVPGPAYGINNGDARADVQRARTLQAELERAIARRDYARVRTLDIQLAAFLQSERNEFNTNRMQVNRIVTAQTQLKRLANRYDRRSLNSRVAIYQDAVEIAQADLMRTGGNRHFARR